jgi:DNA-binding NarL/FixJ family response regulator
MKILLADDHPLIRDGIRQVLSQLDASVEIIDAHDYPSLFAQTALHPDLELALVDLNMPGLIGMQGIRQYRHDFPDIPLVILSASESPYDIRSTLEAGALGYIPKSTSAVGILTALHQVLAGEIHVPDCLDKEDAGLAPANFRAALQSHGLTARQFDVAHLLVQGCANKAIGGMLSMSESTVKVHMGAIFRAFDVTNRIEAALVIQQLMHKPSSS